MRKHAAVTFNLGIFGPGPLFRTHRAHSQLVIPGVEAAEMIGTRILAGYGDPSICPACYLEFLRHSLNLAYPVSLRQPCGGCGTLACDPKDFHFQYTRHIDMLSIQSPGSV